MLKVGFFCLVLTATAGAQAILQQGVAAASGTLAGALAGKAVSDALDSTLKATDSAARTGAVRTGNNAKSRQSSGAKAFGTTTSASSGFNTAHQGATAQGSAPQGTGVLEIDAVELSESPNRGARQGGVSRSSTRSRRNRNARQSAASLMAMTAPQPPLTPTPPPELTLEQALDLVKSVQVGADRPAVISQLGKPAATILIPESSGLREVLYYTSHGDMIGAVSVNPEGSVTEVRTKP